MFLSNNITSGLCDFYLLALLSASYKLSKLTILSNKLLYLFI
nr:MAG TPA: hypothetical protein [Caudoviricetes sp.]